ncbi:sugar phosphate isomerase/epimerase [Rhizobium sp. Root1204]|uniref:sugar phosphate isomerase/epimerase family protein n=1 Tax=Rhizobium sp. Root1204 TaxID=1736428 RepID=UPI0007134935|nr:sugar phosphate isomerase/epimerase [Rhizobium sp. Root1204]KQV37004.1 hypothetical protein ASC96_26650 [Rhizobium sp. Root1204]
MKTKFSLAHLTVLDLAPPEVARVAADAGFDSFGLRLHPVRPGEQPAPVRGDTPMRRELLAIMADTGVRMFDVEAFRVDSAADFSLIEGSLEAAARLGACNALVFIDERDPLRAGDLYGRFCDLAAAHDIDANLEFMPWLGISSLRSALDIIERSQRSNAKLVLDALHFFRADTAISALKNIDPSLMNYVQVCDAPLKRPESLEDVANEARFHRLFPGSGELPLIDFVRELPKGLVFAPEVATSAMAQTVSGLERARRALASSRALVEKAFASIHVSEDGL